MLASNHPQLAGGSHLPDITVITPVFWEGAIKFFVASRGHHADVGGITPGSMPPNSHSLVEEGAAILSFKLVDDGIFQVAHLTPSHCCYRCEGKHAFPKEEACTGAGPMAHSMTADFKELSNVCLRGCHGICVVWGAD